MPLFFSQNLTNDNSFIYEVIHALNVLTFRGEEEEEDEEEEQFHFSLRNFKCIAVLGRGHFGKVIEIETFCVLQLEVLLLCVLPLL